MQQRWELRAGEPSANILDSLASHLNLSPLTARILALRGTETVEQAQNFLHARLSSLPDPDLLPDMSLACGRLEQALLRQEKIAVHGDYDVDGISGTALLVEFLRELGGVVEYHIPLRMKDGYGLSADALQRAHGQGCGVVLTVDCGVSAVAEADLAGELGLDLIITDHHLPSDELPACLALVNPQLPTSRFPWRMLSGVGVAFFLLLGLRRRLRENGYFSQCAEPDLRKGLDLVALGTIADIVPLADVNRILVRAGLELLAQGARPGIKSLKKVADVKQVSSGAVGFRLAPRLNAAGRLEDAALGVQLLLTADPLEADRLATQLDGFNRDRQQLEQRTLEQAEHQLESTELEGRASLVIAEQGWHPGVIGIVASRLVERYHRPTVLIALDGMAGKASARSIANFHLFQALQHCSDLLQTFGGHAMAAGLSLHKEQVPAFAEKFESVARAELDERDLQPRVRYDAKVELSELTLVQLAELEGLAPFGAGNPQPVLLSCNCRVSGLRILKEKHLKFDVEQQGCRLSAIAFGMAERAADLGTTIDLLFRPGINHWRGVDSVQLQLVDFRAAEEG